jgi:hypothetical protein
VTDLLQDALPAVVPYVPAAAYLGCVWLILYGFARVPAWVHATALAAGVAFRLLVAESDAMRVLWPLGVVVVVFVTLVAVAARTVSGVSLFSICVGLALTPIEGWPGLVLGLGVAAGVAATRTWRSMGKERVWFLASDTLSGLGISLAGGFKAPEPQHIPTRDMLMSQDETSAQKSMYLPPYLLAGVVAAAVMAVVQAG